MFDDFKNDDPDGYEVRYLELLDETESSWLLMFDHGQTKWLPKSKCQIDEAARIITVPEWLAAREGLSDD